MDSFELPSNLSAVAVTAALVLAIVADVRNDLCRVVRGRNVVLLSILAWFLVEALQVPAALAAYTQTEYDFGVLCVGLAMVSFLAGYETQGCPLFIRFARNVSVLDDPNLLWRLVWLSSIIGFAPIVYYSGFQFYELFSGILGMRRTWGGLIGRGRYGGVRDALLMLEMFIEGITPFAALMAADRRLPLGRRGCCLAVMSWRILRAYGSGYRSAMLSTLLPIAAVFYWKSKPQFKRLLVLTGLMSAPLIYVASAAMVGSRNSGAFSWSAAARVDYIGHEMFRELLFINRNFPGTVPYQLGSTYLVQLVNPVPRFLWKGKPTLDASILLAQMYGNVDASGEVWMTCTPGLIGEMYLNFGLAGIGLLSLFGGWIVKGWDRIPRVYEQSLPVMIFYGAGLAVLVVLGRQFTLGLFYGLLAFAVSVVFVRRARPESPI